MVGIRGADSWEVAPYGLPRSPHIGPLWFCSHCHGVRLLYFAAVGGAGTGVGAVDDRMLAMMETMRSVEADNLVRAVHSMVEADPEVSGREVLARLEVLAKETRDRVDEAIVASEPDRDECAKCGQPIRTDYRDRERWVHASDGSRGCRAATFNQGDGWDDDIPRSWMATPRKRRA